MEPLLFTALFLPLLGALFLLSFSSVLPRKVVNVIGPGTVLLAFLLFVRIIQGNHLGTVTLFTWIPLQELHADFSLHVDALSKLMTLIITGVGFLIHAYSIGYMDHDDDYARFFSVMNFFIFSMLLLVLANNLLLFFVGWEGVGVASYLLIGFWYSRSSAQKAAKKAFVVNRIGDLGLLLGIFLTYLLFGTGNMQEVITKATEQTPFLLPLALLYFWGACGKSAQMPLHTWLPDAMEGPTPVSALIHAATMVTAGVYLVVRMHPIFELAPTSLFIVALVGGTTALFAALSATSQTDLKRVLAYSTLSQLGLMFLACGFKAYNIAMFHLTTHAFAKALLFLSAGNVIHMLHGTTEMAKMGGLARSLKKTNILFAVGTLSMAGVPPLAIFFSKDLILEELSASTPFYAIGLAVSLLTAFYLTRAYFLTFQGKYHQKHEVHEAPRVMVLPVAILAVLAAAGGIFGFRQPFNLEFHFNFGVLASVAVALIGIGYGAYAYKNAGFEILYKAFYINELYHKAFVMPLRKIANFAGKLLEKLLFTVTIDATSSSSYKTAGLMQKIQSGQIRGYIAWIVAGTSFLVAYLLLGGF